MTESPSQIEWHLARDGHQYGPLSESEMRTFVDLGHLRPTDLIWRAGFSDWRAAPEVFVIHAAAAPESPPAASHQAASDPMPAAPPETAGQSPGHVEQIIAAGKLASAAAAADELVGKAAAAAENPAVQQPMPATAPQLMTPADLQFYEHPQGSTAASPSPHAVNRPMLASEPQHRVGGPAAEHLGPQASTAYPAPAQRAGVERPSARRAGHVPANAAPDPQTDFGVEDDFDEQPVRRRFGLRLVAAIAVLLLIGGGGMVAFMKRDQLATMFSGGEGGPSAGAISNGAAVIARGGSAETLDESFQRLPIWRHIKQEFPEWYAERVQEAVKLASEKRSEAAIAKYLAEAVVALRRKHAEQALTASPERLKFVASAFLTNLQALAKQNVDTCYGFISQGETYPAVLEMLQQQTGNEALQKQVIAVFEAISDGRKTPQSYLPPRKADYDSLAAELTARGWTEADLKTFSDPRALGRAAPQEVCRMVQDWFAAQIAIKDPASQLRLLVESLRPVVAG